VRQHAPKRLRPFPFGRKGARRKIFWSLAFPNVFILYDSDPAVCLATHLPQVSRATGKLPPVPPEKGED